MQIRMQTTEIVAPVIISFFVFLLMVVSLRIPAHFKAYFLHANILIEEVFRISISPMRKIKFIIHMTSGNVRIATEGIVITLKLFIELAERPYSVIIYMPMGSTIAKKYRKNFVRIYNDFVPLSGLYSMICL